MEIEFDWDEAKLESNIDKHKLNFRDAVVVFDDPLTRRTTRQEKRWYREGKR